MATLAVKLQPGAATERIDGWDVDASGRRILKVRVRARPVDGEANEALIRFLEKSGSAEIRRRPDAGRPVAAQDDHPGRAG